MAQEVEFKPKVRVSVNPLKVAKGQMININAQIYDVFSGQPMSFNKIYMQIIDSKGVEVWPLSIIETNADSMVKLISTSDLSAGIYTVRISPSYKLTPHGAMQFEVETTSSPFLVPLIPLVLIAFPTSISMDKIRDEFVEPTDPTIKIALLIYRTERDQRVCPICLPFEGKSFRPDDPTLPRIPQHINCRCNYDIITEAQVIQRFYEGMVWQERAMQAYEAVKLVNMVEAIQQ